MDREEGTQHAARSTQHAARAGLSTLLLAATALYGTARAAEVAVDALEGTGACTTASTAGHPEVEAYSDGVSTWRYVGPHLYCPRVEPDGPVEWVVPDLVLTGMDPDPDTYYCSNNQITNNALTTDDSHNGRVMMGADGDVSDVFLDHIRWDTSSASGMSGGPHFHCPSGDCAVGHWITGVTTHAYVSGCTPWTNPELCSSGYSTGPRASTIRDWVIANM
jgi:hypothetical protein